jgi:hypothetical protein
MLRLTFLTKIEQEKNSHGKKMIVQEEKSWTECDGQQFHQYKQNEHPPTVILALPVFI